MLTTGGVSLKGFSNRLIGTKGIIDVGGGAPVRLLREGSNEWEKSDLSDVTPKGNDTTLSVLDLIDSVKTGREPELSGRKALQSTELIFATYHSSRERAKIILPLMADDSAFLTMVENGDIG